VFSLDECSDIEPISEEDEEADIPDCTVLVSLILCGLVLLCVQHL